jgi:hypothetical protein
VGTLLVFGKIALFFILSLLGIGLVRWAGEKLFGKDQ